MEFTLSLAHFCELHGPTSVMCTQALPLACTVCGLSPSNITRAQPKEAHALGRRLSTLGSHSTPVGATDSERCASCRLSLPEEHSNDPRHPKPKSESGSWNQPRLRTKEDQHVCGTMCVVDASESHDAASACRSTRPWGEDGVSYACHTHFVHYVSSASPSGSETFSDLRRATVRTLSGEQLPRGQSCGPLLFGDSSAGYTIAYVFRLADTHARGRQRYYALLALAGPDTQRAFEVCTMMWTFFEKIATSITQSAEHAVARSIDEWQPSEQSQNIPVSSFLSGRSADPQGFPRGVARVRANGISELVGNENFFYELHLTFASILQELGRALADSRSRDVPLPLSNSCPSERWSSGSPQIQETAGHDLGIADSSPNTSRLLLKGGPHVRLADVRGGPLASPPAFKKCPTYDFEYTRGRRGQVAV